MPLRIAHQALTRRQSWTAGPEEIAEAHDALSAPRPAPVAVLGEVMPGGPWEWLQLTEAASTPDDPILVAGRTMVALSALAAAAHPAVLVLGGDGDGRVGVSLGLPAPAADAWRSDLAPDAIWRAVGPHAVAVPGLMAAQNPARVELGLSARVLPRRVADRPPGSRRPSLDTVLVPGTSLGCWCVLLVLRPEPLATIDEQCRIVTDLRVRAAQTVTRQANLSDVSAVTITDPRSEALAETLTAWDTLIADARRTGGWRTQAYVCALDAGHAVAMAAAFGSVLGPQALASQSDRDLVWDVHPVAQGAAPADTWLSSQDLADLLIPPSLSVGTLQVREPILGGRLIVPTPRQIRLGHWLGSAVEASCDVSDLAAHAFVAGITGSGKSTTTRLLLAQLWNGTPRIPFLVIDPAKGDYAELVRLLDGNLRVVSGADLRGNVLQAWPGMSPARHVHAVGTAFRGSFGLPMPVPYVASILFDELAAQAASGMSVSLHDAMARLDTLIDELHYQGEIESNIRASLGLRLRLLLQPGRAERVAGIGVPTWLLDGPVVVQLSDLADEEERNFLASMLVLWISEAARSRGPAADVQHVTVIEEAHRLMPEPRPSSSSEDGDAGAVSARLMTQLLAEIRAYGESVIVVDQSPAAVAREVLRNTSLKLAHRVVEIDDQRSLGGSLGLDDQQARMLGSLGVGRCLLSTSRLSRPQAVHVGPVGDPDGPTLGQGRVVGAPAPPSPACHGAAGAEFHHASERHGQRMELLVAAWSTGLSARPLLESARQEAAADPGVRPACLIAVGLRRHVRTLVRLGQLSPDSAPAWQQQRLQELFQGRRPGDHPADGLRGPFPACTVCKNPCLFRSVLASRGLATPRKVDDALSQRWRREDIAALIDEAAQSTTDEANSIVPRPAALGLGWCAATQLAARWAASDHLLSEIGNQ